MSAPVIVLLDATTVRVLRADSNMPVASATWNGATDPASSDLGRAVTALSPSLPRKQSVIVVIGLGLLEIAQPELPAVDAARQRALLARDADRYFPLDGAVAVAWCKPFAFAARSRDFVGWLSAIAQLGRIDGVTTVPQCLVHSGDDGAWTIDATARETGHVRVERGALREVRRARVGTLSDTSTMPATRDAAPLALIARGALSLAGAPLDTMFLDERAERTISSGRRTRWISGSVMCAAALLVLAWSADRWRARTLDAANAELARLTAAAAPAQRAESRLLDARRERVLLDSTHAPPASVVLARVGSLLPRDAFVERLEWDGSVWRIDGSASNAPAIVPLLDGDPMFADVRIAAATTRFMDAGRQRESFSVSFRVRGAGGASASP